MILYHELSDSKERWPSRVKADARQTQSVKPQLTDPLRCGVRVQGVKNMFK